jgi:hypothetical protein
MNQEAHPGEAIEDLRETLLRIIKNGLAKRPEGVHLTWLGGEFTRLKSAPFEQYVNFVVMRDNLSIPPLHRKMAPFIAEYCSDILHLNQVSDQTYTVTIREEEQAAPEAEARSALRNETKAESVKIKQGVWPAFIKPVEQGKRRYLNLEQFVFTDVTRKPAGKWKEVKQEYIAALGPSEPIDSLAIQGEIRRWAGDNNVPLETLVETAIDAANEGPSVSDLVRIIRSLPQSVTTNWNIPAEVLRHLRSA